MVVTTQQGCLGPDLIQRLPNSLSGHFLIAPRPWFQKPALCSCIRSLSQAKLAPNSLSLYPFRLKFDPYTTSRSTPIPATCRYTGAWYCTGCVSKITNFLLTSLFLEPNQVIALFATLRAPNPNKPPWRSSRLGESFTFKPQVSLTQAKRLFHNSTPFGFFAYPFPPFPKSFPGWPTSTPVPPGSIPGSPD